MLISTFSTRKENHLQYGTAMIAMEKYVTAYTGTMSYVLYRKFNRVCSLTGNRRVTQWANNAASMCNQKDLRERTSLRVGQSRMWFLDGMHSANTHCGIINTAINTVGKLSKINQIWNLKWSYFWYKTRALCKQVWDLSIFETNKTV